MEKILSVVDKIAPFKDQGIKNNTQDWFDDEVAKAIKLKEKCCKQFKWTKLHIDENFPHIKLNQGLTEISCAN